jgi:chemotaxis protein methyltransferase CheR
MQSEIRNPKSEIPGDPYLKEHQGFEFIRDLIAEKSGIYFQTSKRQYFLRRLRRRMEALGCSRLKDYYHILVTDIAGRELSELLNLLTTTETYFFRNTQQLESFEKEVIPTIIQKKRELGHTHLYLWSAGCSSGEEPYTLAMILLETIPDIHRWKISIVATDINTQVITKAKEGLYSARSLRDTPRRYLMKYFTRQDDQYRISDQVKRMISFRVGNLLDQKDSSLNQNLDCIFCRNVLIYFDIETCERVVKMFYEGLTRKGYLFLGHSESLYRITTIFKLLKLQHSLVYYKE